MNTKKQLLDPLGTICKLITLNFNVLNTKISIHNHILSIQQPAQYQYLIRRLFGDGKENISELYYAIKRVIKWYLIPIQNQTAINEVNETNSEDNLTGEENWKAIAMSSEIRKISEYCCIALRKLQETYEYGNVVFALQFYINILEDGINGTYHDGRLPQNIVEKEENLIDYNKLRNFWDIKKFQRICLLYDDCFKIYIDEEITITEKEIIINGYLKTIHSILEHTDNEFQMMILNNSKG